MTNGAGMMIGKTPVLIGAAMAASIGLIGLGGAQAAAEELRIGLIAPMTGPFA